MTIEDPPTQSRPGTVSSRTRSREYEADFHQASERRAERRRKEH
jgi:hypothetical protein